MQPLYKSHKPLDGPTPTIALLQSGDKEHVFRHLNLSVLIDWISWNGLLLLKLDSFTFSYFELRQKNEFMAKEKINNKIIFREFPKKING